MRPVFEMLDIRTHLTAQFVCVGHEFVKPLLAVLMESAAKPWLTMDT